MFKLFKTLDRLALIKATIAAVLTVAVVLLGSRNLQNFDPALVAYLIGTVFAVFSMRTLGHPASFSFMFIEIGPELGEPLEDVKELAERQPDQK